MKKVLFRALMMVGLVSLSSCVIDSLETPEAAAPTGNFEVVADLGETKTVNNGVKTEWAEGDALNVFSIAGDYTDDEALWSNHGKFTLVDKAAGVFSGTLASEFDPETQYKWIAVYPYDEAYVDPWGIEADKDGQLLTLGHPADGYAVQNGNDSKAHLVGKYFPLYSKNVTTTGDEIPHFTMKQMLSVFAVKVTNTTSAPLSVKKVFVEHSDNNLVGTFVSCLHWYPGFQQEKNVAKRACLSVENGAEIPVGGTAVFYVPFKPNTFNANSTFTVTVNEHIETITLEANVTINSGVIKTINVAVEDVVDNGSTFEEGTKAFLEHIIATQGYGLTTPTTLKNFAPSQYPCINFAQDGSGSYYIREIYHYGTGEAMFNSFPSTMSLPNLEKIYINCTPAGSDVNTMTEWMKCSLAGSEFPTTWNCPKLFQVHLECVGLQGVFSDSFAALPNLRQLFVRCCDFYGALPQNWASGKMEQITIGYGGSNDCPNLGYLVPAELDVILNSEKPESPYARDKNEFKLGGKGWTGFEVGWGQKRYEKFDPAAELGNLSTWSKYRGLTEGTAEENALGGIRNPLRSDNAWFIDSWAYYYTSIGGVPTTMAVWNQADADAFTAAAKAKARIFTR